MKIEKRTNPLKFGEIQKAEFTFQYPCYPLILTYKLQWAFRVFLVIVLIKQNCMREAWEEIFLKLKLKLKFNWN